MNKLIMLVGPQAHRARAALQVVLEHMGVRTVIIDLEAANWAAVNEELTKMRQIVLNNSVTVITSVWRHQPIVNLDEVPLSEAVASMPDLVLSVDMPIHYHVVLTTLKDRDDTFPVEMILKVSQRGINMS